jgi:hypothetical protein
MSQLQEWFNENPKARPLMMFALLGVFCLGIGIWSTAGSHKPVPRINRTPDAPSTQVPTLTGGTPTLVPSTKGYISEKDTPVYDEPGLNRPVLRKLSQWEEVFWLQEVEKWDQLRLADGSQGWVQSKFVQFARPANLDKPNEAEVTVMAFYAAVVRKDYAAAYAYLAGPWKAELDFNRFVEGYSRTNSLSTEITEVIPIGDNRFQVDVKMTALEQGQEVPYMGSYLVEKVGGDWSLSSGSLTLLGGPRADPRLPLRVPVVETPTVPEPIEEENDVPEPDEASTPT